MHRLIPSKRLKTTLDFDGDLLEASVDDTDDHMDVHKEGMVQASH